MESGSIAFALKPIQPFTSIYHIYYDPGKYKCLSRLVCYKTAGCKKNCLAEAKKERKQKKASAASTWHNWRKSPIFCTGRLNIFYSRLRMKQSERKAGRNRQLISQNPKRNSIATRRLPIKTRPTPRLPQGKKIKPS